MGGAKAELRTVVTDYLLGTFEGQKYPKASAWIYASNRSLFRGSTGILHRFDFWYLSLPKNWRISLEAHELANFLNGYDFTPKTAYTQWRMVQVTLCDLTPEGLIIYSNGWSDS